MLERDGREGTLPATPRRLEEARREGNVPRCRGLSAALALLGAFLALDWLGPAALGRLLDCSRDMLSMGPGASMPLDAGAAQGLLGDCGLTVLGTALPLAGVTLGVFAAAAALQGGIAFRAEVLLPQASRWNPLEGLRRLISIRAPARAFFAISRIGVLAWVFAASAGGAGSRLLAAWREDSARDPLLRGAWSSAWESIFATGIRASLALAALGVIEYAWERWLHARELRMTPVEVEEEVERIEGKGEWRQQRRRVRSRLRDRMRLPGEGGGGMPPP